jgi:hypothetical protein
MRRRPLSGPVCAPAAPGTFIFAMSTRFLQQVRDLARGPEGRRLTQEAKRLAKDPRTRARIDEARRRLSGPATSRRRPA